jgi:hypothetical protein
MMRRRTLLVTVMATAVLLSASTTASAHRSPAGCLVNGVDLVLFESSTLVRPGDTMTFRVGVQNTNQLFGLPCDISNANVGFRLPTATGRYDPASVPLNAGTNQVFPFGFGPQQVGGDFTWVVNLADPRATTGAAQAAVTGKLHIIAADPDFAAITKDISFTITNPSITIDKKASPQSGQAPLPVTYTYLVTNTSQTVVPLSQLAVTDDKCNVQQYPVGTPIPGDDGDRLLENGETWTFTCTTTHTQPGTYVNTAKACAVSTVDDRPVCSPPDTETVVVTAPPAPPPAPVVPQGAVKPVAAAQAPCQLSTAKSVRLRAGELTTIRVRTRAIDGGTNVTITLPGGKKVNEKVGKDGIALFHVRPTRSGTANIKAAQCSDVQKLTVRPARQVVSRRVPRVTG